jgi:Ca-activated chloride channel family protein
MMGGQRDDQTGRELRAGARYLLCGAVATGVAGGVIEAQQPTPSRFELAAELVTLNVVVTDGEGRSVPDLPFDAFEVFEDDVPQRLLPFAQTGRPVTLTVLLDASASMDRQLELVRSATLELLATVGTEDAVQLVQVSNVTTVLQPFTSDRAALESAVNGLTTAAGSTAIFNAVHEAFTELAARPDSEQRRRSAVMLLTDGDDNESLELERAIARLARDSRASLYVISLAPEPDPFLTTLSSETGGRLVSVLADDLEEEFARVGDELRGAYGLGYVPSNTTPDGSWREIEVRLIDPDGRRVRFSEGYYAEFR